MRTSLVIAWALLACACGQGNGAETNVVTVHPAPGCDVTTADALDPPAGHLVPCTPVTYPTTPPSGGNHYSIWADYRVYATPVPWGFLVHDMEHGGVVLSYDPALTTIADLPTKLQAFVDAYPADPACTSLPWRDRLIVSPEPGLGVPLAASAWGHVYRATCWDEASLRRFVDAHYAMGPEDLCSGGEDLSATAWCPAAM